MIDLSQFRSFSLSRICTHRMRASALALACFVCLCASLLYTGTALAARQPARFRPDVLVLVLGGFGPSEQCSINYNSVVPLPTAQADLDKIAALGKWQVRDAKGETKSAGGPKPVPTTSISFMAKSMIDYANGTLPLEPYVVGLKRLKFIEIDFITPSGFVFRGLKDFESRFVKIQLSQSGNSYRYRIVVKDAGFEKLDLPLRQAEKPEPEVKQRSRASRILVAVGFALLAALLVYIVMTYLVKRR